MGKKLPPDQLAFYRRVDEILFYKWDPIGISGIDWSRDEYHAYLPQVFGLALSGDSVDDIAGFLTQVSSEHMGLSPRVEHDREIAGLILDLKQKYLEKQTDA